MKNKIRIIVIGGGIIIVMLGIFLFIGTHTNQSPTTTNNTPGSSSISPTPFYQQSKGRERTGNVPAIESSPTTPVVTAAADDNAHNLELIHQLQKEPDLFLSNKLPYETNDFAASAAFTTTPTNHFYFTVLVKNGNTAAAMDKFQTWLQSLGLSQQQITQLDIRYQAQ